MSELINNSRKRVDELKRLILNLHHGVSLEKTRGELVDLMGAVPYGEVVQAEEELISEGLDREDVLKFCDIHTDALKGHINTSNAKEVPENHPVDVFQKENKAIGKEIDHLKHLFYKIENGDKSEDIKAVLNGMNESFNLLADIEKHYARKENLVFPYLEKNDITGPPMVMWGKDDEIRSFLKSSLNLFRSNEKIDYETAKDFIELMFKPTIKAIEGMIYKEEKILFPMCMDTLTELDWYEISRQSQEIGFCIYAPKEEWKPDINTEESPNQFNNDRIQLSTGSFTKEELEAFLNTLNVDLTFVDKDDKVKFFSHGNERIFDRNNAILGRQVQYCHPPSSVHIVDQILDDFKSGKQNEAIFWINFAGKLVHIAYYAVRNDQGKYMGTLEVTQDIQHFKNITGERRLLTYKKNEN